jgi:hypothetical protein
VNLAISNCALITSSAISVDQDGPDSHSADLRCAGSRVEIEETELEGRAANATFRRFSATPITGARPLGERGAGWVWQGGREGGVCVCRGGSVGQSTHNPSVQPILTELSLGPISVIGQGRCIPQVLNVSTDLHGQTQQWFLAVGREK